MPAMIVRSVAAALVGLTCINKALEAARCHRANKTSRKAKLPDGGNGKDAVVVDGVGAEARGLTMHDGLQLYVRDWLPPSGTALKGLVVIVHGGGWHSAPHAPLARYLNSLGFVVVAHDMRGHGLSGYMDGLRNYWPDFQLHCTDLVRVIDSAKGRHPGLPYFVFTESMGGGVLMCTLAHHANTPALQDLSGYVMMAPFLKISDHLKPPAPVLLIARVLSLAFPKMVMPDKKIEETFDGAFPDKQTGAKWRSDPLVHSTAPMVRPLFSALGSVGACWGPATRVATPFMIIGSMNDIRTQVKHAEEFCAASVAHDKSVVVYKDGAHQLLQDTPEVTARVMHDTGAWLLAHVPA